MIKAEKLFICVSVGILCQPAYSGVAGIPNESPNEDALVKRISLAKSENTSAWDMARLALSIAEVPGGIVIAGSQSGQKKHSYTFGSPSALREVLDTIVSSDDLYLWRVNRGVVNLVPRRGVPPILETRIAEFNPQAVTTLTAAADLLLRLPEVQRRMRELNYSEGFSRLQGYYAIRKPGLLPEKGREPLSIHVKNVSLLVALNAIVRAHGRGVWIYNEYSDDHGKHYFEVSITAE